VFSQYHHPTTEETDVFISSSVAKIVHSSEKTKKEAASQPPNCGPLEEASFLPGTTTSCLQSLHQFKSWDEKFLQVSSGRIVKIPKKEVPTL